MKVFQSKTQHNNRSLIRKLLLPVVLYGCMLVLLVTFPENSEVTAFLFTAFLLADVLRELSKKRINEIIVDSDQGKILIKYFGFPGGSKSEIFTFEESSIEITHPWFLNSDRILTIQLRHKTKTNFTISEYKDGFQQETLKEMASYLEGITHPKGRPLTA